MSSETRRKFNPSRVILFGVGAILLLLALLFNEILIGWFDPSPPLRVEAVQAIRSAQKYFAVAGLVFLLLAELIKRISWLGSTAKREWVPKMLLALIFTFVPLSVLELSLRPIVKRGEEPKTTIFMRDPQLGWRHKPNSEGIWGRTIVKINGKGLRGPELDYAKPPNTTRILFLGDSVTFGDQLKSYEQTFPYLTQSILERRWGRRVEAINAGVSGYSPWQEDIYLEKEGIKYGPDLVVVSFVLNDVTEKFGLVRFGGTGEGWQLSLTYSSRLERLLDGSSIYYFIRKTSARWRFGKDPQAGAKKKEAIDVKSLVEHPEQQEVLAAWKTTLEELDSIFRFCREQRIPVFLVVFPVRFQFDDVNTKAGPQKIVTQHALDNQIPVLDLLPILDKAMKEQGKKPEDYFLDSNHPSPAGNEFLSNSISDFIEKELTLSRRQQP